MERSINLLCSYVYHFAHCLYISVHIYLACAGCLAGVSGQLHVPVSSLCPSLNVSLPPPSDSLELRPAGALSHAAAKHRIAVRPRRNHGASRPRRPGRPGPPPASLPATVEEETSGTEQSPAAQDSGLAGHGEA